jgi:hypothetical protein
MAVTTTNVTVSRSGTGWTVDVTACNLSINTAEKDIQIFHNGAAANIGDYTKTTPTLLTYSGTALGASTVVDVHRFTDVGPLTIVGYADRLSSSGYNSELDRLHRIIAEGRLNGIGGQAAITVTLDNAAYNYSVWSLDTIKGATRQALANQFLATDNSIALKAPLASPVLTGTPTAPSPPASDATLRIANTGWAQSEFLNKLGGTVTGATDFQGSTTAITRAANDNTTKLATTAYCDVNFVDLADTQTIAGAKTFGAATTFSANTTFNGATNTFTNAVALNGATTAVTKAVDTNTTDVATTAYVIGQGYSKLASPTFTGTPAAPTAAADTNTTQIATTAYVIGQAGSALPLINGTAAVGTSLRYTRQDHVHPTDTTRAATASPTFTGTPAAPTAAVDTNTTQLATTAFVVGQAASVAPLIDTNTAAVGTSLKYARQDHSHANGANSYVSYSQGTTAVTANTDLTLTENEDTGNNFATSTYTAPTTGVYLITANFFTSVQAGLYIRVNNTTDTPKRTTVANAYNGVSWLLNLTAGNTFKLRLDTTTNLTIEYGQIVLL